MNKLRDYSLVKKGDILTVACKDAVWEAHIERMYSKTIVCSLTSNNGRLMVFSRETGKNISGTSEPALLLNIRYKPGDDLAVNLLGKMLLSNTED